MSHGLPSENKVLHQESATFSSIRQPACQAQKHTLHYKLSSLSASNSDQSQFLYHPASHQPLFLHLQPSSKCQFLPYQNHRGYTITVYLQQLASWQLHWRRKGVDGKASMLNNTYSLRQTCNEKRPSILSSMMSSKPFRKLMGGMWEQRGRSRLII